MPTGVETSPEKVAEFRAAFLYSGNASGSAREVGLPESTGRDLAKKLESDPSFVEDRRNLRAGALDRLVAMRMRVAERAVERFEEGMVDASEYGENVTVIDKRADYGKLVLDAEKNAQHLARYDAERDGELPVSGVVNISVSPTPQATERTAKPDESSG